MQNTNILKKRSAGEFLLNYALYIILGAILVGVSIARPNFLKVDNIMQILKQASTKGILALGCAGLIVLAGTDLSIGRVLGLSAAVCASLVQRIDYPSRYYPQMTEQLNPFLWPLLAAVAVAVVVSLINGFGVAHLKMHAFIITLGMQLIAFGANCLYIEGQSAGSAQALGSLDRDFLKIAGGNVILGDIAFYYVPLILIFIGILTWVLGNLAPACKQKLRKFNAGRLVIPFAALYIFAAAVVLWIILGVTVGTSQQTFPLGAFVATDVKIPYLVLIFLGIAGIMWVIWNKTRLGKNMFAVGGNQEAAAVSGVNVARTIMLVYLMAGILYGLASFLEASRIQSVGANTGINYETDAISACVIGGVSFSGGVGTIQGVVIGAIILQAINFSLNFLQINPYLQYIVRGLIIVLAVAIDVRKYLVKK